MTPRVDLRPVEAADRERLLAWRNSPDARASRDTDEPISPQAHDAWFETLASDEGQRCWIIELDGAPVGLANLYDIDRRNARSTWSCFLADPEVRRAGLGSYVEYWMLEYVFEGLKLAKIWCEVLASNVSVRKLHEAFGFQVEARFRGHAVRAHKRVDVLGLGMLAADWRAKRTMMAERLRALGFTPPEVVAA